MTRLPSLLLAVALVTAAAGCVSRVYTHGDPVDPIRLRSIVPGTHSRADVAAALGSPSTASPFIEDSWYYISSRSEGFAFMRDEEVERLVVAIRFGPDGTVSSIEALDLADGQTIDVVERETPSFGEDTNIVQDLLKNVGRFETQETIRR